MGVSLMNDSRPSLVIDDEQAYKAPAIARLGTLAELTLGGTVGPDDGLGGDGDGSVG